MPTAPYGQPDVGGTLFAGGGGMGGTLGGPAMQAQSGMAPGMKSAPSLGKNSQQQNLGSPHSGLMSTLTGGDPMHRAMGHYGKQPPGVPSAPQGLRGIRGGTGTMRRIRGGLGPGKTGTAGGSGDYSMTSMDTE
jgi:hypothetical protein